MAKYTTTIDSLQTLNFDFGMRDYPIWSEDYRQILNRKILNHYRFREIGFETPALFKFYLNRTLTEIMPYYNELYATKLLQYNPLHNVDYTIEHTKTVETATTGSTSSTGTSSTEGSSETSGSTSGTSSTTSNGTNSTSGTTSTTTNDTGKTVAIDTPQSAIDIGEDVNGVSHASNVGLNKGASSTSGTSSTQGTDSNTTTGTTSGTDSSTTETTTEGTETTSTTSSGTGDETETFSQRLIGNYGVKSSQALIQETRDIIINIDMMIIEALHDLFMEVY